MEGLTLFLVILSTFLGAWGSYFFKISSKKMKKVTLLEMIFILTRLSTIMGFAFFITSSLFYIWALSRSKLTMVYPLTALSYIWAALIGKYVAGETVDKWRWISILFIFFGVMVLLVAIKN